MIQKSKKIKILFAIGRLSVGGAEKLLVHQLRFINRNIFHPKLITMFDEQKESLEDQASIDECFHFRSIVDISAYIRLYFFLRSEQFDVIVTSLFSANLVVRMVAIIARIPVIISYEHNIYPDKHHWQIIMDRILSHWTNTIIVDSEIVRTFTAKQESISSEKFLTLYIPPLLDEKPIHDSIALRQALNLEEKSLVVLTVSRLVVEKGHRYLIEAARKILRSFPYAYFLIVGWGPLEQELKSMVQKYGIADHVRVIGRMDIQDVLPIADIYVDPAISTDLPIAIMEAMRRGKAIVATSVGEIPKFIQPQKTGLLSDPKDSDMLAECISVLLKNPILRKELGAAAQQYVADFSLERYMTRFEKLILGTYAGNIGKETSLHF